METNFNQVTQLAALNYSMQQICVIMDIEYWEAEQAMEDRESDLYRAYWKGFYETDIQLRQSIFKLAINGSSPAQALAKKIVEQNLTRNHYDQ